MRELISYLRQAAELQLGEAMDGGGGGDGQSRLGNLKMCVSGGGI